MTGAAWGFMGTIWALIFICIAISMRKIVLDNK